MSFVVAVALGACGASCVGRIVGRASCGIVDTDGGAARLSACRPFRFFLMGGGGCVGREEGVLAFLSAECSVVGEERVSAFLSGRSPCRLMGEGVVVTRWGLSPASWSVWWLLVAAGAEGVSWCVAMRVASCVASFAICRQSVLSWLSWRRAVWLSWRRAESVLCFPVVSCRVVVGREVWLFCGVLSCCCPVVVFVVVFVVSCCVVLSSLSSLCRVLESVSCCVASSGRGAEILEAPALVTVPSLAVFPRPFVMMTIGGAMWQVVLFWERRQSVLWRVLPAES